MDLIIESDIGHDPDDFFAINYLIAAGVNIRTILISPGDPDQIAVAKLICDNAGLNIPIGVSHPNREKLSSGSIHHELLKKYNYPLKTKADGLGADILTNIVKEFDCELFVIGPVSSIGKYLQRNPEAKFSAATMQGGFLPYSLYMPAQPHPNFLGKEWLPTFNLNGDRPAGETFLKAAIAERRMVGKNVCHTILFDKDKLNLRHSGKPKNEAAYNLFWEAAEMYLQRHNSKKFHDPIAAVCHLHPEVGTWFGGKTVKRESGWTTEVRENNDFILADLDREFFWEYLVNFEI